MLPLVFCPISLSIYNLVTCVLEGPGNFVVMPTTFSAAQETSFDIKVLTSNASIKPVVEWLVASVQVYYPARLHSIVVIAPAL